jgi:two-component system CheB/CheR fusion protein
MKALKDQGSAVLGRALEKHHIMPDTQAAAPLGFPIVGIGASAGGLEACRTLIAALSPDSGMAFILVQHLAPNHASMLVELLRSHTVMPVREALQDEPILPDHVYVIPAGADLSVHGGRLQLTARLAGGGPHMPFDLLLESLARDCGARALAIVLSGTGSDGSLGVQAIHRAGGMVIAQAAAEAAHPGMPNSAIATGCVDHVLTVADMPPALLTAAAGDRRGPPPPPPEQLRAIIELLRARTKHDFSHYKIGTLQRRIERRVALSNGGTDMAAYLATLHADPQELDLLATDLLINVTSFFRDPKMFHYLERTIIPAMVRDQPLDQPLRIWIAGCSTGEETYSFAILLREAILAAGRNVKLQIFSSDRDAEAVAIARSGVYAETIAADVSKARLARFFIRQPHGYKVTPELRSLVIFTVHDVLVDPPFARVNLVSCRNLLIYLQPDAQTTVIDHCHFALLPNGVLVLGSAETIRAAEGLFEVISKTERIYRRSGSDRPQEPRSNPPPAATAPPPRGRGPEPIATRPSSLADLVRRMVLETYAPAAVLINRSCECLYYLGPTDDYLRVPPGLPNPSLLSMVRDGLRSHLRAAITRACEEHARVTVTGGRMARPASGRRFNVTVTPVPGEPVEMLLICFIDEPSLPAADPAGETPEVASQVQELEREIAATRRELGTAIRDLELATEEQRAVNEEASSVNEEHQAANEELLTSKEELQSLNEELNTLNSQLQETLERQRTTSNDLKNILYSTDVATLFLDTSFNIRFFTPTIKLLFNVIPGDIGRPIADLSSLAADGRLLSDAQTVLKSLLPIEREIEARTGAWYIRRVLPYRTQTDEVEGVVVTFVDITERRRIGLDLKAAERQAQLANVSKSRFLAAASHDLRQPLQTLALLQGLLAKSVTGPMPTKLVARLNETLGAMTAMLNTLLDINQIEAGTVSANLVSFPVNDLLEQLKGEFIYNAQARGLSLRVVPCSLSIQSDPSLLEQMLRNLLSNALKYTRTGRVLLGCRRQGDMLSVEIWDTGIGIPNAEHQAIFEEYHQLDNAARERSRGLGLGLSIVKRLGDLMGHRVRVRSRLGFGSVFSVEVALRPEPPARPAIEPPSATVVSGRRVGSILVIEDDPDVSELLALFLANEGHSVSTAADGMVALELVRHAPQPPDLILADYNLPNGLNGLQVTTRLREMVQRQVPVVILTGEISTRTLREIAMGNCVYLSKPVKVDELNEVIQRLLPQSAIQPPAPQAREHAEDATLISIVDDDAKVREALRQLLEANGHVVEDYATSEAFLTHFRPRAESCLLLDANLPGMSGVELLQYLRKAGHRLPAIMITGYGDVRMAVAAMSAGASDFIEKPVSEAPLMASIARALEQARDGGKATAWRAEAAGHLAGLTARQREIMYLVLAGHPSKNIAMDLDISQRTVENHRAAIMARSGVKSLPELARLVLAAEWDGTARPPI